MKQFDTLPIQCRHIEHLHEGIWFKVAAMRTFPNVAFVHVYA